MAPHTLWNGCTSERIIVIFKHKSSYIQVCGNVFTDKIGQKERSTETEKELKLKRNDTKIIKIAKLLKCDHQTIKSFVNNSQKNMVRRNKSTGLCRINHEAWRNPLAVSASISLNYSILRSSWNTRCTCWSTIFTNIWVKIGPRNTLRLIFLRSYGQIRFEYSWWSRRVISSWITNGHRAPLWVRSMEGGGGVMG